jgi:hypothetical protein
VIRGTIHEIQDEILLFSDPLLLLALRYIPHPEIVTNIGAAIPPIAAEKKAIGWSTEIPSGGIIAAVWT